MHCDQVRQSVLAGGLMPSDAFDAALRDWLAVDRHSTSDGEGFIRSLFKQQLITEIQAGGLLAGVSGPYRLGHYEVYGRITAGRLGTVFRARHPEFDQTVSLKVFPVDVASDRESAGRLTRELRIAVQVDHPNVIRTFQVGRAGETVFAAIEDLQGETLATRLKRESSTATPSLPLGEACRVIREAALGMSYLHGMGVILRDVQPANLWLSSGRQVKVMEFGAARDSLDFLDDADSVSPEGSDELRWNFDYVSPEQGDDHDQVDARSDIYSLGCVAFHCLTGRVVFNDKNPLRKMIRHARDQAPSVTEFNSSLPPEVARLVAKMLAKNPADRPVDVSLVAAALEQFCDVADVDEEINAWASVEVRPAFLDWVSSNSQFEQLEEIPQAEADPAMLDFLRSMTEG